MLGENSRAIELFRKSLDPKRLGPLTSEQYYRDMETFLPKGDAREQYPFRSAESENWKPYLRRRGLNEYVQSRLKKLGVAPIKPAPTRGKSKSPYVVFLVAAILLLGFAWMIRRFAYKN